MEIEKLHADIVHSPPPPMECKHFVINFPLGYSVKNKVTQK